MLHIACPDCANPLKVEPEAIGNTVTCPACGQKFMVSERGTKPPELVPQVVLEPVADDEDDDESDSDVNAAPVSASQQGNLFTKSLSLRASVCIFFACIFVLGFLDLVVESRGRRPLPPTVPAISPEQPDQVQKELKRNAADQPK
jgi:uncharacterized Zn finger protein (UPF0148 family)